MTALVLAHNRDIFSSNDCVEETPVDDKPSPHTASAEEEGDAHDDMDTTSSRAPSPPPLQETQDEQSPIDTFDQMLDNDLEQLDEEERVEPSSESTLSAVASLDTDEVRHGGISNLMNTCYMASALQMLASLESFVQLLRELTPKEESPLRTALLDLWERLERGETVRPMELKRVIDERSCLFEGYDQQDSHEFLTTLLDLLDENYKGKDPPPAAAPATEAAAAPAELPMEGKDDADMDIDQDETPSCKRIKTCPPEEEEKEATAELPALESESTHSHASGSYSELDVHQIEALLHGNMPSSREGMIIPAAHTPMSCRLVGGRMNPAENSSLWNPTHAPATAVETSARSAETSEPSAVQFNTDVPPAAVAPNPDTETKPASRTSPIDDCFATKVRVRLTCDSCKYTRTQDETYLHWSLEMSGDTSVDECFRRFFASEKREVKCEKCFGESATQTSQITQLPKMLLLHFKRFVVKVSEDYSSISYEKNSSSVAFEPEISPENDLQDYTAVDCAVTSGSRYQLRSIINHHGSSVSFGHYTADAKRTEKEDDSREWLRFNDSFVSRITEHQVQESCNSAYLVMYELE